MRWGVPLICAAALLWSTGSVAEAARLAPTATGTSIAEPLSQMLAKRKTAKSKKAVKKSKKSAKVQSKKSHSKIASRTSAPLESENLAPVVSKRKRTARIPRTGVAELDRLLAERPALGGLLSDSLDNMVLPETQAMASASKPSSSLMDATLAGSGPSTGPSPSLGLLGVSDPLVRLQTVADPYIGAPYRAGGNGNPGFDCSGFVNKIFTLFGMNIPGRSSPAYWTQGEAVDESDLQPGDLVFFSDHNRSIGHVGIFLSEGRFVHSSTSQGVVVSRIDEAYYRRRYKGARRLEQFSQALVREVTITSEGEQTR